MLNAAIGGLLPSAFAVALSPIPIVAVVLVLGAPRARTAGPAFALGWILGLLCVSVVVVLLLGSAPSSGEDTGINWFKVAIGVLFSLMAAQQWTKRPKPALTLTRQPPRSLSEPAPHPIRQKQEDAIAMSAWASAR